MTSVNNLFTTPCFSTVLNEVQSKTLQNTISRILKNTFGKSDKLNIDFTEANLHDTRDADEGYGSISGEYKNLRITLNTPQLATASKEYIAATIMHEVLHAYFKALNVNPLMEDHNEMGLLYVDEMAAGIREVYPSISADDAKALA